MSFIAKIFIDGEERNILNSDYIFKQLSDASGRPVSGIKGGLLKLDI